MYSIRTAIVNNVLNINIICNGIQIGTKSMMGTYIDELFKFNDSDIFYNNLDLLNLTTAINDKIDCKVVFNSTKFHTQELLFNSNVMMLQFRTLVYDDNLYETFSESTIVIYLDNYNKNGIINDLFNMCHVICRYMEHTKNYK